MSFYKSYQNKRLKSSAPESSSDMEPAALFRQFRHTLGWSLKEVTDAMSQNNGTNSVETVKKWSQGHTVPTGANRQAFLKTIQGYSENKAIANSWLAAFERCWGTWKAKQGGIRPEKIAPPDIEATDLHYGGDATYLFDVIRKQTIVYPKLNKLPSLFESDQALSLANTYVDLRIVPSTNIDANPLLLHQTPTLSEALRRKNNIRFASTKSDPQDLFDKSTPHSGLIIGPPGSGKSSLLRHVAISIAQNRWHHVHLPLFVEAKSYWAQRTQNDTLISFALRQLIPEKSNLEAGAETLLQSQSTDQRTLLLLVDGLDEIASTPLAWETIANELLTLASKVNWLATCRPTGLLSHLGESLRCEMVELDDTAIETLIENWCRSVKRSDPIVNAKQMEVSLKMEILQSGNPQEVVRNPFLLSALCFLKTQLPDRTLPVTRIEIYESLLSCICKQAQRRHIDKEVLSTSALQMLQAFCFHLYSLESGVIQVFREELWAEFSHKIKNQSIDFQQHIVPGRLISSMGEIEHHYHFIHLSLQEHLIAKHLVKMQITIDEMLKKRFIPAWRPVFRFYACLLFSSHTAQFKQLILKLYQEVDINSVSLIMLAEIFADTGIRDTSEWLGVDLREALYQETSPKAGWQTQTAISDALLTALTILDAAWYSNVLIKKIEKRLEEEHTAENASVIEHLFRLLAETKSHEAYFYIRQTFNQTQSSAALLSWTAFLLIATRSDRAKLIAELAVTEPDDEKVKRMFECLEFPLRQEFIPFLQKVASHYFNSHDYMYFSALSRISYIGGRKAELFLADLLDKEVKRYGTPDCRLRETIMAIEQLSSGAAVKALRKLAVYPDIFRSEEIAQNIISCDYANDEAILQGLSHAPARQETVAGLFKASAHNRAPSEQVTCALLLHMNHDSTADIDIVASIELTRIRAGHSPVACNWLLNAARHLLNCALISNPAETENNLIQISNIFEVLALAKWEPAQIPTKEWLLQPQLRTLYLPHLVNLAGELYYASKQQELVNLLKEMVFDRQYEFYIKLLLVAIGKIDIEQLNNLKGCSYGKWALGEIASETGILIFESFWVDPKGQCHEWGNPPEKIHLLYYEDKQGFVDLAYEFSRFGCWLDDQDPSRANIAITHCSPEQHLKILSADKRGQHIGNIVNIPNDINEAKTREWVATIARELTKKRHISK